MPVVSCARDRRYGSPLSLFPLSRFYQAARRNGHTADVFKAYVALADYFEGAGELDDAMTFHAKVGLDAGWVAGLVGWFRFL